MSRLAVALSAVARHEAERRTFLELGVVSSVFDSGDDAQTATVTLRDTGEVIPRVPVAVPLTGLAALPRIGDVVLVAFPGGQPSSPVIVGQVYSDARRPPESARDDVRLVWPGDTDDPEADAVDLTIHADGSSREVTIALGGDKDARVRLADGELELTSGGVSIKLAHGSSSDATAVIKAGGASVEIAQDGDVSITSPTKVTIKAKEVAFEADVSLKVKGQTVEIN